MGKRVLIVDDAAFMRMMIKDILVKTVSKLPEKQPTALKLLENKEVRPIVTMDITMPKRRIAAVKEIMPLTSRQ